MIIFRCFFDSYQPNFLGLWLFPACIFLGINPSLLHAKADWIFLNIAALSIQTVPDFQDKQDKQVEREQIFSGPQVEETLPAFSFRELLVDSEAGDIDLVTQAGEGPILLVFVHDANRPSIGMTRVLTGYAKSRMKDGLTTGVIFLNDDITVAEANVKRIQHALTPGIPTGVALEGQEGPGSYGLNRNVTMTILVAKDRKVTANFALTQPSAQADLPKVLESLVAVIGGTVPKLEDLEGMANMLARPTNRGDGPTSVPNLRPLLMPLIQKTATEEQVVQAAIAIEEAADQDAAVRKEVGRIAKTIVDGGVIQNYGTVKAQEYLRKWAIDFVGDKSTHNQLSP